MKNRFRLARGHASSKALIACAISVSLSACGGAPSGIVPAAAPTLSENARANAVETPGVAKLEMSILIPRARTHADYISRSTQSIVLTEGKKRLRPLNTVVPSRNCSVQNAGTLCVFRLEIQSGRHQTFTLKAFDKKFGHGNLLSLGTVTKNIRAGALNVLAVTLAGIPHSIELTLQGNDPPAGTPATQQLSITAKDADGNVIVGAGSYRHPIAFVTNDTKGIVTVSPSSVTALNQSVTLSYDGRSVNSVVVYATSTGIATQTIVFAPKPTVIADYSLSTPAAIRAPHLRHPNSGSVQQPTAVVSGPDGNLWTAVSNAAFGIVRMSTSGTQTFFKAGRAPSTNLPSIAITGLAAASDGNVWYVDNSDIGFISPSTGTVTDFPLTSAGVCPGPSGMRIAAAPASYGGVWATVACAADSQLVHVASNGTMTFYTLTGLMVPKGLAVGRDGSLYVAGQVEANSDAGIAQAVISGGAVVSSSVHDITAVPNLGLVGIAQSADGDIWATTGSCAPSAFIRLHTASTFAAAVTDVFTTLGCSRPYYLTALPDGSLWAPHNAYAGASRITPGIYPAPPVQYDMLLPTPGGAAGSEFDVALGPDGDLYFSDDSSTATATGDLAKVAY